MKIDKNKLFLLVILLIALFLRLYDLDKESIWYDESASVWRAQLSVVDVFYQKIDLNPPLYTTILHFWINLFGESDFAVRFPSVILGLFAVYMIYKIGRLIFDREAGIISSLILGLSVFHIGYSQEARPYALMVLLVLFSMYFFIKLIEEKNSKTALIGYIFSNALLMYTHVYGLFIILAQNIYLCTSLLFSHKISKSIVKRWFWLQFILFILFIPWIKFLIKLFLNVALYSCIEEKYGVPSIFLMINSLLLYSGSSIFLFFIFLGLCVLSIITYKKIKGGIIWNDFINSVESFRWDLSILNFNKTYFLLVWLFMPIIIPFIISQFTKPFYCPRYAIGSSLAFYLLVAKGIKNINHKYVKAVVLTLVIVLSLISIFIYYAEVTKPPWRDVAGYINTNTGQGDLLLINPSWSEPLLKFILHRYSVRSDLVIKPFPDKNIKELNSILKDYNKVWVVMYTDEKADFVEKALSKFYNLSYRKEYLAVDYEPYSLVDHDERYIVYDKYLGLGYNICNGPVIHINLFEKKF